MKRRLDETVAHLRKDIDKVDEPQLKAMFETSAEVLGRILINGYANRPANDSNLEGGNWIMAHRRYDLIEFA